MSVILLGSDGNPWTTRDLDASANNKITVYGQLSFSGSYVTAVGGDTLDLTAIAAQVPGYGVPDSIGFEMQGGTSSFSITGGYLQIVRSAISNALHKVGVWAAGGTEQGSGTYASIKLTAATEYIPVQITWRKMSP